MAFEGGVDGLRELIERIESDPSRFEDASTTLQDKLQGMSGLKFRLLMSEAAARMAGDLAYLELGIYQGADASDRCAAQPDAPRGRRR